MFLKKIKKQNCQSMNFLSYCSKNANMIFFNFEKKFPHNRDFLSLPTVLPILCFFVCSAFLAQTTRLIPLLDDDPYLLLHRRKKKIGRNRTMGSRDISN